MLCSELILSFACVYFVVSVHFMPFSAFQFDARTSHPLKKVRLEKSGSLYVGLQWSTGIFINYTCWSC